MKRNKLTKVLLVAGLPLLLIAWNKKPHKKVPPDVPVTYYKLKNGLKVVLSPDKTSPTIGVGVYYNIGFRIEPKNRTGFAHLFEHMMFQGSQNLGKMEFIQLVQKNGGILNGSTRFDFTNYWFHRTAHKVPLLWRFHRVHHSDASMDASTNFRGHPIESIFWFGTSNIVTAAVFGLDLMSLGLFFLVATPFFFFEHANFRFPKWLDKTVGLVFTTPNLHKVHHEQDQYYTDSNFSDIFILWDKIFGTYKIQTCRTNKIWFKRI